jgi:hypothetical protein
MKIRFRRFKWPNFIIGITSMSSEGLFILGLGFYTIYIDKISDEIEVAFKRNIDETLSNQN